MYIYSVEGMVLFLTDAASDDLETPTSQIEDPAYPDQLAQESLSLHTLASPEGLGVHVLPPPDDVEGLVSVVPSLPSVQLDDTSSVGNSVVTDDPAEDPELLHPDQIAQESQVGPGGDGLGTPTVSFPSPVTASSPHPSVPSGGIEGVAQNPHFPPNQYPQDALLPTSPRFFNPHIQAYYPFPGPDGYPTIDPYRFYDQQRLYDQLRRPVDPSKIPPRRTSYNPHPVFPSTIFAPPERPVPLPPRRIKTRQPVNVRAPLPRPTPQTPTLTSETSEKQASSETNRLPDNDTPGHTNPEVPQDVATPLFQPKREQWNSKIFFEIEQSRQQLEEGKQQSDTEDSASLPLPEASAEEHSKIREQSREERPEEGLNTETSTEDRPKPSSSEEDQGSTVGNAEIPIHDHEDLSPLVSSAEKTGITFFPQDVDEVFQFEGSERDVSAAKPNSNRFVQLQPTPTDLRDIDASLYEGLRLPYYSILDEPAFPNGNQQIFEALENVDPSAFNEAVLAFEPQRTSEPPVNEVGSNVQQNLGIPIEPVTQKVDTGIPATTPFNNQPQPSQQNLPQLQGNSQFADFYDPGFLDYVNALYRAQAPDYDYFYDYDSDYNIGSTGQFPGNQNSVPQQLQGGIPATSSGQPGLPPTGPLFNPWGYPISPTSPTRGSQTSPGFPQQFFPQNIPFPTGFPVQGVNGNQTQGFPFNPLGFQQQGILPFGYTPTPTTFLPGFQSSQIPAVSTPRIRFQDDTVLEISPSPNPPIGVTDSIEIQTPPSITFEASTPNPQTNENGKTDNASVSGVSQSTLNSLLTTNQTQVVPQQNISLLPPPSTFASPVQVPLPNDSLPAVSQENDALQSPGPSDQAVSDPAKSVPQLPTGPAQNTLLTAEESGGLGGALGSVVPVKNVQIASPNQPQNLGSESVKPSTATEITLNNVTSIPAVSLQNTPVSSGNLTPNIPTQDKTPQAVQFPSTFLAQAVQLPGAFPTQNTPPQLAIPTQGIPLSSLVPTQDIQRPITVPSLDDPSQNAQLPTSVPTQGIPLLSGIPAQLYYANGTQGLQLLSTLTTQNTQLPSNIPPQNVQGPSSVQTQNVQIPSVPIQVVLPPAVQTQSGQQPLVFQAQGVQLPSAVPTQGVQLPSAVPTQVVQLPSAVPTQGVQLPSAVPTQGIQLPSAVSTQGIQLPSAVPTQSVQLPSAVPTQGVQLPSAVPTQGVQLPSAVPTQGVQLPSAVPTQGVQLPSAVPTQGVQLPSAVPTQGIQLPSAVPIQGIQLPSAVPTQGVQLPSAVPSQGIQRPLAVPTQGVQRPSVVPIQGVQLPSTVPTQGIQLPSAVPTQGVQLPSAVPTQGVQLPSAVPTQGVQLPSAVPTQGVQLPSAVPTQGIQLPSAVPTQGIQLPSAVPTQGVQLPSAVPTQGIQLPSAVPTQGIQLPSAVPTQGVQLPLAVPTQGAQRPSAVPTQGVQLPSVVPTQGVQLPSAVPTQGVKLPSVVPIQSVQLPSVVPIQGVQLPSVVPTQGVQRPSAVPTQGVQLPSVFPIQGVQLPSVVPTQGVQRPSAVPTQGVQLPSVFPIQGVQLPLVVPTQGVQRPSAVPSQGVQTPSVVQTQGVQRPSAVPTQGVQLPSAVPTQGVQLPSAVSTQGVQGPSAIPTQGVQLPSAFPTQGVQRPSAVSTQGVQLPSAVPTQGVQLPSAVSTQGVQGPSAIPTQGVQLPSAFPTQGVQRPSAVSTQGVQLPSAVPTQGVQLPSAVSTQGVQGPSATPTQGVQLPSAFPTQGVQRPSAVSTQGVQLPSAVPTQGVQRPSAVPTQGVQLPSAVLTGQQPSIIPTQYTPLTFRQFTQGIQSPTASSQGIQLPSLVPTQNLPPVVPVKSQQQPSIASAQGIQLPSAFPTLSSLVPTQGARPPSAVPTQAPSQRVPVPSEGAQILSGFLGPLSQTTPPHFDLSTLQDLQIPLSPEKGKSPFSNLPGNDLPEITQAKDKTNTIGDVVTRPPLSVLTPRPPTAILGTDPIRSPAAGSPLATPTLQTEAFNDFMNFFGLNNGDETSTLNPTTTRTSNEFAVGSGLVVDSKVLQDLHNLKNVGPRQDTTTRNYPLDPSLLNSTRLFANLAEAIRNTINPSYFILTKHDVGNYSSPPLIRNSQHKQSINRLPAPKSVSETVVPAVENSSPNALKVTRMNAKMPHLIASLQAMMDKSPRQPQDSEESTDTNGKNKNEKEYSGGNRVDADEFLLLFSNKSPILPDDGEYIILIPRPTELKFPTDTRPSAETTADIFTQGREFLELADNLRPDGTIKPHSAVRRRAPAIDPAEERIGPIPSSGETEDLLEHPVRGAFYGLSTDPGTLNWLAPYSGGFGLREPRKEDGSGERTEKKIDDAQTNSSNLISDDYEDFPLSESNTIGVASPPTLLPEDLQGPTLAEYYAKYFTTAQDPQVFFNPLATGSYPAYNNISPRPTISGVRSPEQYGYFYQGQYPQFNLGVRDTGANPYDFAFANFPTAAFGQDSNAYSPNQTPQDTTPADNIGSRAPAFPESAEEVGGLSYDYKDSFIPDYLNGGNQDYSSDTTFDSVYSDYDVQLESNINSTGLSTTNPLAAEGNIGTGSGDTFGGLDANVAGLRVNGGADVTQNATQRPDFPTVATSQEGTNTSFLDTLETVLSRNKEDFDFNSDVPVGDNVRYDEGLLDAIISGEVREDGTDPSGNIPLDYDYSAENIAPGGIPLPPVTEVPASLSFGTPGTTISTIEVDTDRSSFSESADGNSASGLNTAGTGTSGEGEDPRFTNVPVDILVFTAAPTSGFQPGSNSLTPDDNIFTSQTKRVTPESNIFTSIASRFTPESNIFTSQGNVFTPSSNAFTTEFSVTTPIDSSFIYKKNNYIPEDNNFTPIYNIPVTEDPIIASFDVVGTDLTREGPFNAIPTENPISNNNNDENISQDNASGVFESTTTSVPVFETTTMSSPVFETTTESLPAFETTTSVPVIDTTTLSLPPDLIFPDDDDSADASVSNGISTAVPDVLDAILHVGTPGNPNVVFGGEVQLDQNLQGFSGESQTNTDIQGNEEVEQTPSDNLSFPQVPTQNESPAANQQVTVDESQQASDDTKQQLQRTENANETSQNASINQTADVPFTNEQAEREESSGVQISDATSLSAGVPLNTTAEQTDTKDERPNLASQLPFLELPEGAFGFTVTLGEFNNTQSLTQENIDNPLQNNTKIVTEDSDDRLQTATQNNSIDVSDSQTEEKDVSFRQGNDTFVDLQSNDTATGILINESTVEDTVPLLNIPGRVEPSGISSQTPVDVLLLGESHENTDAQTSAKGTQGDSNCNDTGDLSHNAELTIDFSSSEEPIILLDSSVELASIEDRGKDKNQDFVSLFQDQLDAIRKGIDEPSAQGKTPELPVPGFTGFGEKNKFTTNLLSPTPSVQKVTETTTTTVYIPIVKPTNSPSTTKKVVSTLKGRPTTKPGIWRPTFGLPVQTQTSRPTSFKGISNQPSLASFLGGSTPPANFGLYGNSNNQQSVGAITTPGQGQYTRPSSIYDNAGQQQNLGTYSESQGQTQKDNEREKWVWRNTFSSLPIRGREEYIKNRPQTYNTNNFAPGTGSQGGNHYAGSTYAQNRPKHTEYGKDSETDRWVWTSNRGGSLPNRNPPTPFPLRNTWVPDNYLFSPSVVNYVYSRASSDTSETPVTDSAKKLGNRVTQSGPTTTTTPYYWYSSHSNTDPRVPHSQEEMGSETHPRYPSAKL
ncbi:mucin-17-like [Penaeus chinensis]|uniref:mucin-17-like n=1 Tax=Penaeus chinensis TaxID=139456 RepID=UPI001FB6A570|nr:mucin-17-like [Penaeus chinensis]